MNITKESNMSEMVKELKALISRFDHRSFTASIAYMGNVHIRHKSGQMKLRSPVRQMMYLASLYHATDFGGKEIYLMGDKDHRHIVELLNRIELAYSYKSGDYVNESLTEEEGKRMIVSKATFLNYFLNAHLSFVEQDIERLKRTFQHYENYIIQKTGLSISDYLSVNELITFLETQRISDCFKKQNDPNNLLLKSIRFGKSVNNLSIDDKVQLYDMAQENVISIGIPIEQLYQKIEKEKVQRFLAYFTMIRQDNQNYSYYTDPCTYLEKPVLMMDGDHIALAYSKQLISAIYDFLYDVCSDEEAPGRKVSERRDEYLEEKTEEVFQDFFGPEAQIYTSYYVDRAEKDIMILYKRNVFIIECKAHKYRTPMRDHEKAYNRIKDDFQKSIGKGYQQAKEVEELFISGDEFKIFGKGKKIIANLKPEDYDDVFLLIVTQERFGQIQCDLGYLLEIDNDRVFPWSVAINDLETFLITLKRRNNHAQEFIDFLILREQLQQRVACSDELELCAYFLFDLKKFTQYCKSSQIFLSSPDVNQFFDLLYGAGFGFKDELNLDKKLSVYHSEASQVAKVHKLKQPERIIEYLKNKPDK